MAEPLTEDELAELKRNRADPDRLDPYPFYGDRFIATIDKLRDDASDLVDAGDALGSWAMEAGYDGLMAVAEWRNCPARAPHRRWKRKDYDGAPA